MKANIRSQRVSASENRSLTKACSGRGDSIFHGISCDVACVGSRRAAEAKRYAASLFYVNPDEAEGER